MAAAKPMQDLRDAGLTSHSGPATINTFQFECKDISMTSLLTHTVEHSTRPSFSLKTNNQPLEKNLSLPVS